ncbi:phospholipase D-like domain-containing protein DpdK [Rhodospirillales bacterium]|nr:phospholipase D-like domain-containing protein DpdK [Rhodospirillales bacterium]
MRDLTGPLQATAIADLLQSIFVAEALYPSDPIWILSGWISDIPVIENGAREFGAIDPDWPTGKVRLSQVLRTMLSKGGRVALVLRDVEYNKRFLDSLTPLKREFPEQIWWTLGESEHQKGIVGQDYDLAGSMNFTPSGIGVNGEHLIYRTAPETVASRRLEFMSQWPEAFDNGF